MDDMLRMSHQQVLDAIRENVKLAVGYTDDVEFCAQDATRTELDFLLECFRVAVECRRHDDQRARHGRVRHARPSSASSSGSCASGRPTTS